MVFSSISFIFFFFPIVFILYYLVPSLIFRNILLLLSSLLFYTWGNPAYIFLMLFSIILNYSFGYLVSKGKKILLILGILLNLSLLFFFKYFDFTLGVVNKLFHTSFPLLKLTLPIGISFYTFQAISYIVDVYKDARLLQKNPLNLALYISFFPQLVAGPILRYTDI